MAWRPLTGAALERRTSAVWPDRSPHPAAETFGAVAARILAGSDPAPRRLTTRPQPWTAVYDPVPPHVDAG
ncbi:MAG TPA: hypothetical protein VK659_26015 [Asanoa sp.]|nr:hypothetical protein [Asanoa sp.]